MESTREITAGKGLTPARGSLRSRRASFRASSAPLSRPPCSLTRSVCSWKRKAATQLLAGALLCAGCSGSDADCVRGEHGCPCTSEGRCDANLQCVSARCEERQPPCRQVTQSCDANEACCGYASHDGPRASCVSVGDSSTFTCREVCESGSDCASGCCAPVKDQTYRVCAPPSLCADPKKTCLAGLAQFCACGELADSPCDEDLVKAGASICGEQTSPFFTTFMCLVKRSPTGLSACTEAVAACMGGEP